MGRFVFYAASQAYYSEARDAFPEKGVRNYGELFHKYNIPMTWLTNSEGARRGKAIFTEFHQKYGDEVILWAMPSTKGDTSYKRDYCLKLTQPEIEAFIKSEQLAVQKALPFAQVDHIGYFYRTLPAVKAMQKLGVKSCYGHCWEMIATDGVTDHGTPWGFYYLDTEVCWKRPLQQPNKWGIIANEWLQHDLNKPWNYFGSASVFSFDPNDVERGKVCDGRQCDYWKTAFREYYRNRAWNAFIPFVLHQEAHEQESTPGGWDVYDQKTVDNTYEMTDEFLQFIKSDEFREVEIATLPHIIEMYRALSPSTLPTYMRFNDIPIQSPQWQQLRQRIWAEYQEIKVEEEAEGGTLIPGQDYAKFKFFNWPYGWEPMVYGDIRFPESFVYADAEVQLFFHHGTPSPIKMWNYLIPLDPDPRNLYFNDKLFTEDLLPIVQIMPLDYNAENSQEINIDIRSSKAMPYGICLWGDIAKKQFDVNFELDATAVGEVKEIKAIGNDLLFLRMSLGDNGLKLTLNLKT